MSIINPDHKPTMSAILSEDAWQKAQEDIPKIVRLFNREDTPDYDHLQIHDSNVKLTRVVMSVKQKQVDGWQKFRHSLSISDTDKNYHICARDCVDVGGEKLVIIGASFYVKGLKGVPLVYGLKIDFYEDDLEAGAKFKESRFKELVRVFSFIENFQSISSDTDATAFVVCRNENISKGDASLAKAWVDFSKAGVQAFKYENLDKVISDLEIMVLREAEEKALFLPVPEGFVASLTGNDQESSKLHEPKVFFEITEAIKMGKDGDISKLAPKTPPAIKVLPARNAKSSDVVRFDPGTQSGSKRKIPSSEKQSCGNKKSKTLAPISTKSEAKTVPKAVTKMVTKNIAIETAQATVKLLKSSGIACATPVAPVAQANVAAATDEIQFLREQNQGFISFQQQSMMRTFSMLEAQNTKDGDIAMAKALFSQNGPISDEAAKVFGKYMELSRK